MYVTLSHNLLDGSVEPLFYSEGLLAAKRDLKAYAQSLLASSPAAVLTYKYSLDEFDNALVARFADEKACSSGNNRRGLGPILSRALGTNPQADILL